MKNVLFKVGLVIFVFALLIVVPLNLNLTYGYSTNTTDAPTCGNEKPDQPVLFEPNHALLSRATGAGEVRLNWLKAARANKYTVGFGLSSGNYIYGANDIADTDNFTVRSLTPGTRYYFAVKGVNECKPGDWSREWSAVVGGGGGTSTTTFARATGRNTSPTIVPRRGTGNLVPTVVVPTIEGQAFTEPTPTPTVGFFQRIFNFFFRVR